jgi:hypothetical protein
MSEENNQEPYVPMADAYAPPKEEEKPTFNSDMPGIEAAANELSETRAETDHGRPVPENQTIDLKRAVDDLTRQRGFEAEAAEQQGAEALANEVDAYRAAEQQQQKQQQQQQAPEPQPQPQIPADQIPPGVDIEVVQALTNNPKLRQAVEAEVVKADQARQQYAVATQQAAQVALASVLAQYPEIQGLSSEQLPVALQIMAAQNPQRHAEVVSHLQRAEQIYRLHQQAQGQNAAIMQAQLQHWAKSEDQKMDSFIATQPPETVRTVKENLVRVMAEKYGISQNDLAHAFATTPLLRAEPFQRALFDLVRHHVSNAAITDKKFRDAPPVQRPGVASDRSADDAETSAAYKAFIKNPDPRSAAAFIMAKRSARR